MHLDIAHKLDVNIYSKGSWSEVVRWCEIESEGQKTKYQQPDKNELMLKSVSIRVAKEKTESKFLTERKKTPFGSIFRLVLTEAWHTDVTLSLWPSPACLVTALFQLTLGCPQTDPLPTLIPGMSQNVLNQHRIQDHG